MQFKNKPDDELLNKNFQTLNKNEIKVILLIYRPEYEKILKPQDFEVILDFFSQMLKAGQTLKDTLWWLDQFMFQKTEFLGLKKQEPLFIKFSLNAKEMIALVRMAYSITTDKKYGKYFKERANGYKGGLIKYFIDSTRGAFDKAMDGTSAGSTQIPRYHNYTNMAIDPRYFFILAAWNEKTAKLSKDELQNLFTKIAGDKLE
ncbi:MAG: hypothetical protein N3D10_02445 [Candidatus Micrarchaeota archaeon]|nr:hypothetical protein [Candidatus Micrarchaeota archaeon]